MPIAFVTAIHLSLALCENHLECILREVSSATHWLACSLMTSLLPVDVTGNLVP